MVPLLLFSLKFPPIVRFESFQGFHSLFHVVLGRLFDALILNSLHLVGSLLCPFLRPLSSLALCFCSSRPDGVLFWWVCAFFSSFFSHFIHKKGF